MADTWGGAWGETPLSAWGLSWGYVATIPDPTGWHCPRCGQRREPWLMRREWNGLKVCNDCWDPRHPQETVAPIMDAQQVRGGALPEPADVFAEPTAQSGGTL